MSKEKLQILIGELEINSYPLTSKGTYERYFDTTVGNGNKRGIRERELVSGLFHMKTRGYTIEQFARAAELSIPRLEYIIQQAEFDPAFQAFRDSIFYDDAARDKFRSEYRTFDKFGDKINGQDTFLKIDNEDVPDKEIGQKRLLAAYYLCTFENKTTRNVADALVMNEDTLENLWNTFIPEPWFQEFREDPHSWATGEGNRETNYLRNRCFKVLERANINTINEDQRIQALRYHPDNIRGIKRSLYSPEKYHEYCRIAVKANGLALQHVPDEIKKTDREMCLDGVKEFGAALKYIPLYMRDREICKAAVSSFGYALWDVPPKVKDRDICWIAVNNDGRAIEFAPKKLISQELFNRAEVGFRDLYRPYRFAPNDAKLNRIRRTELAKEITGIAVRNLPKKAPVVTPSEVTPADFYYLLPRVTRSQKKKIEEKWDYYSVKIAEYANRAIAFRMGDLSAIEFLKQPPFNYATIEMSESWAFREAVTASEYWVQKYPEKMRLYLMPKPYFISKIPINIPLLSIKQCREANPFAAPLHMNKSEISAFQILETYHAELAIAYRLGLITAKDYFNTPPAPNIDNFKDNTDMKITADKYTSYYANLFKKEIEKLSSIYKDSQLEAKNEKTNITIKR